MIHSQLRASLYSSGQPGERMIPLGAFKSPPHGANSRREEMQREKDTQQLNKTHLFHVMYDYIY